MKNNISPNELVINPTKLTQSIIVDDVLALYKKHENNFLLKSFFARFRRDIVIKLYLKSDYMDYYNYLKNYTSLNRGDKTLKDLKLEFNNFYNKLIFNNFALVYASLKEEGDIINPILTKEDEKNIALKKVYEAKISRADFNKDFGHLALNAYELQEKRFFEYSDEMFKKIVHLAAKNKINKNITLDQYINKPNKEIIPILICLRELAKYHSLRIVANIRFEVLKLAEEKKIEDVFYFSLEELRGVSILS